MTIQIEIPDRLFNKAFGLKDIRIHMADNKITDVTTDDYEKPYYKSLNYKIIEEIRE